MVALKSLFFTILGFLTVPGIVPWLLLQWSGGVPPLSPSIWLVGLLPLLVGVGLFLWCNGLFTFTGHGTLAPISAPIFLVRTGPYHWVRNPMYLALFLMISGEALLFHSLWLIAYCTKYNQGMKSLTTLCRTQMRNIERAACQQELTAIYLLHYI